MHTVDAALALKRQIACYYPDTRPDSFEGNEYIVGHMKGKPITKHMDLSAFLDGLTD